LSSKGGQKQWIGARVLSESQGSVYRSGGSHRHARKQDKGMGLQRPEAVGSAISQCPKDVILFPDSFVAMLGSQREGARFHALTDDGACAPDEVVGRVLSRERDNGTHPTQGS
jgi:hypothetical protein